MYLKFLFYFMYGTFFGLFMLCLMFFLLFSLWGPSLCNTQLFVLYPPSLQQCILLDTFVPSFDILIKFSLTSLLILAKCSEKQSKCAFWKCTSKLVEQIKFQSFSTKSFTIDLLRNLLIKSLMAPRILFLQLLFVSKNYHFWEVFLMSGLEKTISFILV